MAKSTKSVTKFRPAVGHYLIRELDVEQPTVMKNGIIMSNIHPQPLGVIEAVSGFNELFSEGDTVVWRRCGASQIVQDNNLYWIVPDQDILGKFVDEKSSK